MSRVHITVGARAALSAAARPPSPSPPPCPSSRWPPPPALASPARAQGLETPWTSSSWGARGTGPGQCDGPVFVAVDDAGDVYVTTRATIACRSSTTTAPSSGSGGPTAPRMSSSTCRESIAFFGGNQAEPAHYVYVVDGLNNCVKKFTPSGSSSPSGVRWALSDGDSSSPPASPSDHPATSMRWIIEPPRSEVHVPRRLPRQVGSSGSQFSSALGVAVDSLERVYVADSPIPGPRTGVLVERHTPGPPG